MSKPRYMIKIEVAEISEDGTERDTFAKYQTHDAIDDAQTADWIAQELISNAAEEFGDRDDHSPVTPEEEEPTT